jgi:hypothetical protein
MGDEEHLQGGGVRDPRSLSAVTRIGNSPCRTLLEEVYDVFVLPKLSKKPATCDMSHCASAKLGLIPTNYPILRIAGNMLYAHLLAYHSPAKIGGVVDTQVLSNTRLAHHQPYLFGRTIM